MESSHIQQMYHTIRDDIEHNRIALPSVSLTASEHPYPYHILISSLISTRTKDQVTLEASRRLFQAADTPQAMVQLNEQKIADLIFPAGFYRTKARQILELSRILISTYQGQVPDDPDKLLELPGVGRKIANLTLSLAFKIEAICVDTHVHRIANRLGWVSTASPEDTERKLQILLPRSLWIPLNETLVLFGQHTCVPVSPYCSSCVVTHICPKHGVSSSR